MSRVSRGGIARFPPIRSFAGEIWRLTVLTALILWLFTR